YFSDWSAEGYRNAIRWFRDAHMIDTLRTGRGFVVTVCNYDKYQDVTDPQQRADNGLTTGRQRSNKEQGTSNKEQEEPPPPKKKKTNPPVARGATVAGFDQFWASYPLKVGKLAARRAWVTHKCATRIPVMLASLEKHKASSKWKRDGGQYIPHPTTYLNQGREFDEIDDGPSKGEPQSLDELRAQRRARQEREAG
ncbi:MAG TPA: hypothetical protein VM487_17205, partial [Phycisphaerae bacterium]|nr:hypothetical protein [Phycisphaerae bacterium]